MKDVEVRRATPAHLASLLAMLGEFYAEDGHEYDEGCIRAALEPLLTDDARGQVWVLQRAGDLDISLLGYAVLTWGWSLESGGREGLLDEFFVVGGRRRGGLGGLLIDHIIAEARAAGCRALFLETERPNHKARAFYDRHGLEEQESIWMSAQLD